VEAVVVYLMVVKAETAQDPLVDLVVVVEAAPVVVKVVKVEPMDMMVVMVVTWTWVVAAVALLVLVFKVLHLPQVVMVEAQLIIQSQAQQ
jgi:hypothetical protein